MDLSVVVPCYNEEEVLPELFNRLSATCSRLGLTYELILVNDGSRDRTWTRMVELSERDPHVVSVNLSRNYGHQIALTAGLSISRGRMILAIDADLQDPPELLPEMIRIMGSGADVVYGRRRRREGESGFKLLMASLFYRTLDWLSDTPIPRDTGDFRLVSRRALDIVLEMHERHRFLRGMVSWIGLRQEPVSFDRHARFAGTTKYPLRKMLRLAGDAITSSSTKPLLLVSYLGAILMPLGCFLLLGALLAWRAGDRIAIWLGLLGQVTLLGGFELIGLGIVGAYLGRLFAQAQGRPLFIIDRVVRPTLESPGDGSYQDRITDVATGTVDISPTSADSRGQSIAGARFAVDDLPTGLD